MTVAKSFSLNSSDPFRADDLSQARELLWRRRLTEASIERPAVIVPSHEKVGERNAEPGLDRGSRAQPISTSPVWSA